MDKRYSCSFESSIFFSRKHSKFYLMNDKYWFISLFMLQLGVTHWNSSSEGKTNETADAFQFFSTHIWNFSSFSSVPHSRHVTRILEKWDNLSPFNWKHLNIMYFSHPFIYSVRPSVRLSGCSSVRSQVTNIWTRVSTIRNQLEGVIIFEQFILNATNPDADTTEAACYTIQMSVCPLVRLICFFDSLENVCH